MAPSNPPEGAGSPSSGTPAADRKGSGSVKRARQLLEAGVRPERSSSPVPKPPPILIRNVNQQMKWPLRESSQQPYPPNHHPRYMVPRGPPPRAPPPQRPQRPGEVSSQVPSPSVYTARSSQDNARRPTQPSSHPHPNQPPSRPQTSDDIPASPVSTTSTTLGGSIATDELFRRSGCSSTPSVPDVPPFPPPPPEPQYDPRRRTAGLVPPPNARRGQRARRSSVSPIPEENPDPRNTLGSLASSRAMPSSWGSGLAESEILGAYLDVESDSDDDYDSDNHSNHNDDNSESLVRSASLGKRGKPTMRTFQKPGTASDANAETQSNNTKQDESATAAGAAVGAIVAGVAAHPQTLRPPTPERKGSASTASSDGSTKGVDPEKPPIVQDESVYSAMNEKKEDLPMAAPTMSDNRPGGRKPPRLDMGAVRNAEARGSLSSLTELIRRATKLASNLDRGRTASRADLVDGDFKGAFGPRHRNSGSLSDILASFPPPGLSTPDETGRQSWPVFFGRSNLRHIEPLSSNEDGPDSNRRRARCCGMPKWVFIFFCTIVFILVVLAIVLPVVLVAVPNAASRDHPTCAETVPCHNGGVSVSSGSECSCVCSNGYMGPQCTINGDGSCITAEVSNSSMTRNATMGSALPSLFQQSEDKFGMDLDPITLMALFSVNNISCKTENALVSFSQVNTGSSSNSRRSLLAGDDGESSEFPSPSVWSEEPTAVLEERAVATMNGILYDDGGTPKASEDKDAKATQTTSTSTIPTATPTANSSPSSNSSSVVPVAVVEFSQVSVLYILQRTGSLNAAMSAESRIESYLTLTSSGDLGTLEVDSFSLDFSKKTIHRSGE
ncbi:hypothetical protein N7510_000872 [Penicillium lagena]|uniref:uncharacterized protein n=1 Tax=Penicillium lagena TaxID=94218 RepID=UPI0025414657|nr:uncharacterized protein N7510_000872 [Penicillium lagena]KAJ5624563.1 hypothetical protein N7510_000872 [Penicillium lagena]